MGLIQALEEGAGDSRCPLSACSIIEVPKVLAVGGLQTGSSDTQLRERGRGYIGCQRSLEEPSRYTTPQLPCLPG